VPASKNKPHKLTPEMKIRVIKNGPYRVTGNIPLARLKQVMSDKSEPLSWQELSPREPEGESYELCRCGLSENLPFCDGKHARVGFDGTETARTDGSTQRSMTYRAKDGFNVTKILPLCMAAGFCVRVDTAIDELVELGKDKDERQTAMKMVEDCPAGSLIYRLTPDGESVEKDLPPMIAETIEGTSYGTIRGPFWVMGYIPIERSDKVPFIARNRVTLCGCGMSSNKPLCDGTHRVLEDSKHRRRR
jgi:CDGSH-type Zn-finger protein